MAESSTHQQATKACSKCGQTKVVPDDFPKDSRNNDGVFGACKACISERASTWQANNPDKVHAFRRARYNIDFNTLWEQQHGLCALCTEPMLPRGQEAMSVVIDHDHNCCPGRTGKSCGKCVRGLLHQKCNRLLGFVEKSPARIKQAAEYLDRWRARMS